MTHKRLHPVRFSGPSNSKVCFGQVLVSTIVKPSDFAREVANGVLSHAEHSPKGQVELDLIQGKNFVTRKTGGISLLRFIGDLATYLETIAPSFSITFRRTNLGVFGDFPEGFDPRYLVTLSSISRNPSSLSNPEFLDQFARHLEYALQTDGSNGRSADLTAQCITNDPAVFGFKNK
jgi:hypothetical protein